MIFKNNLLIQTIQKIVEVLPYNYKKRALGVMFLLFLNSILEIMGLAAVIPVITLILQENAVQKNNFLNKIYDSLGFSSTTTFVVVLALGVLMIIVIKNIISLWITKKQASFSFSLYKFLSIELFKFYYEKGYHFFKENNANYLIRNINGVPLEFANNVVINSLTLLNEGFILLLLVIAMFFYDPLIVLLLVVTILPVFFIFYVGVKNKIQEIQVSLNDLMPEIGKNLFQAIYGYIDVKISNSDKLFINQQKSHLENAKKLRTKNLVYQQTPTKVIETAMMASVILIAIYGVVFLEDRQHLIGLISVFALAAYRILPSVNRIMIAIMGIKGYQYTFDIVGLVKFKEPEGSKRKEDHGPLFYNHTINIDNLTFSYSSENLVLKNINLIIKKGDNIGIIGQSGSGKSTFINILMGFLKPIKGRIYIDGIELTEHNLKEWRKLVGYVQQDVFILDASLAENIAFGCEQKQIDYDRISKILTMVKLEQFVKGLPHGLDTRIGERGSLISGGQRQRLGIARAIYQNAQILVLDEATSALDNETEIELTEAINSISNEGLTIVVIAHRLTTLRNCNHIVELSNGEIIKEWAYFDLMNEKVISHIQ